jgi:hypothetical protein
MPFPIFFQGLVVKGQGSWRYLRAFAIVSARTLAFGLAGLSMCVRTHGAAGNFPAQ